MFSNGISEKIFPVHCFISCAAAKYMILDQIILKPPIKSVEILFFKSIFIKINFTIARRIAGHTT